MAFERQDLPRGGTLVRWGDLSLQIGAYPETIKDTLVREGGVPGLFVAPETLFDVTRGVSTVELEFPVYYNFFLNGRKTIIVCRPHQMRAIVGVLRESVFGPTSFDLSHDFAEGQPIPDLAREMRYFRDDPSRPRGKLQLRDMVDLRVVDGEGCCPLGSEQLWLLPEDRYRVARNGHSQEFDFEPRPATVFEAETPRRYRPPYFAVTVIGSGHGFDPTANTSGFVLWVNGRGVLVDPPVDTTDWLRANGIDTRLIEDLVLTHCHADHDAGALQKVLQEGRIRLHTTPTILKSFIRKYRRLLRLTTAQFHHLFDFRPVRVGEPINICGAHFNFRYMLHTIPTLGFDVDYRGRAFAYSCDTLYNPDRMKELVGQGYLSPERLRELVEFRWNADLIFHEAGIPPIHTPVAVLCDLPAEVKQRTYLTHITETAIPVNSGLRLAPPGPESTLTLEVTRPPLWLGQRVLDVLANADLFRDLPLHKGAEFLRLAEHREVPAGEVLVKKGDPGDSFYLILTGEADVFDGGKRVSVMGRYDYFGEMAVMFDIPRTADVVAHTDMELLAIPRRDFLQFIEGTPLPAVLRKVSEIRLHGSWPLLGENRFLANLSTFQKTQLVALMTYREVPGERLLYREGDRLRYLYLVGEGEVEMQPSSRRAGPASLLGRLPVTAPRHTATALTLSPVKLYVIAVKDLETFFRANPGTGVRFLTATRDDSVEVLS